MDAVTYPSKDVIEATVKHVIPLRVAYDTVPLADKFNVKWTPSLHILDSEGKVHLESTGFLPPAEFIPWIILGRAMMHFDRDELKNAGILFDSIKEGCPENESSPQAVFFDAVCEFKKNHKGTSLKTAYEKLKERYPESIWTKKALPYRLL